MMQRTLNKQDGRLTIGLDLGDRSSFYCVLDEAGEVLLEQKASTTPKAIEEIFGAMLRSRIALETGTHSPWVSRLLSELGHEPIVAHARRVRLSECAFWPNAQTHVAGALQAVTPSRRNLGFCPYARLRPPWLGLALF